MIFHKKYYNEKSLMECMLRKVNDRHQVLGSHNAANTKVSECFRFVFLRFYFGIPLPTDISSTWTVKACHATGLFLYSLKTSENQRCPDVFRGFRKRLMAWNRLAYFASMFSSISFSSIVLQQRLQNYGKHWNNWKHFINCAMIRDVFRALKIYDGNFLRK